MARPSRLAAGSARRQTVLCFRLARRQRRALAKMRRQPRRYLYYLNKTVSVFKYPNGVGDGNNGDWESLSPGDTRLTWRSSEKAAQTTSVQPTAADQQWGWGQGK